MAPVANHRTLQLQSTPSPKLDFPLRTLQTSRSFKCGIHLLSSMTDAVAELAAQVVVRSVLYHCRHHHRQASRATTRYHRTKGSPASRSASDARMSTHHHQDGSGNAGRGDTDERRAHRFLLPPFRPGTSRSALERNDLESVGARYGGYWSWLFDEPYLAGARSLETTAIEDDEPQARDQRWLPHASPDITRWKECRSGKDYWSGLGRRLVSFVYPSPIVPSPLISAHLPPHRPLPQCPRLEDSLGRSRAWNSASSPCHLATSS